MVSAWWSLAGQESDYGSALEEGVSCVLLSLGATLWEDTSGLHLEPLVTELEWILWKLSLRQGFRCTGCI